MKFSKKIVAIMIVVMFALLLGCTDTVSHTLTGSVSPLDSTVTISINGGAETPLIVAADGSFTVQVPDGLGYAITYSKTGYTSQTIPGTMGTSDETLVGVTLEYK